MRSFKRHIAILLFGFFFFPTTFQSIHVIWHNSQSYNCDHSACHAETAARDPLPDKDTLSEVEKICPICEYHFPIKDFPGMSFFRSMVPVIASSFSETATQQYFKQSLSGKSPRAPPIYFS